MWAQGNQWGNHMPLDAAAYQNMNHELGNEINIDNIICPQLNCILHILCCCFFSGLGLFGSAVDQNERSS